VRSGRWFKMLQISRLTKARLITMAVASIAGCCSPLGARPADVACPTNLMEATRIILVVAPDMNAVSGTLQLIERRSKDAKWNKMGEAREAVLGRAGVAWAWNFAHLANGREPVKQEGDGRTPAGFFAVGRAFGFAPATAKDYVQLEHGKTFCVNDVRSPHYNTIVTRAVAGPSTSGEAMRSIPLYRRGLFIDYPTNRERKGGSCIFIHLWRSPNSATAGCVALAEPDVADLQNWAGERPTLLAILSQAAFDRMRACFKGL
jgi:L,D-peptidoglycan transpeptidase YkuD (ErfK/YbiS/YcfS/YnhG family)